MSESPSQNTVARVFEVLVREHDRMLLAYLRCLIRDPALVDDAFQETLITAWRRFEDFDSSRQLGPWLRGIALNVARNAIRKHAADRHVFSDDFVRQLECQFTNDAPNSFTEQEQWQREHEALQHCMKSLPKSSLDLLQRRYHNGQNASAIAEQLERTSAAIRKELQRTRRLLGECIRRRIGNAAGELS